MNKFEAAKKAAQKTYEATSATAKAAHKAGKITRREFDKQVEAAKKRRDEEWHRQNEYMAMANGEKSPHWQRRL